MEMPMADEKLKQQQQEMPMADEKKKQQQQEMVSVPYYDFFTPNGKPMKLCDVQINKSLPFYNFLDPMSAPQAPNIADKLRRVDQQHNQMDVVGQNWDGTATFYGSSFSQFGGRYFHQ